VYITERITLSSGNHSKDKHVFSSAKSENCNKLTSMSLAWISEYECLLLFSPDEPKWFLERHIGHFHRYSSMVNTTIKKGIVIPEMGTLIAVKAVFNLPHQ